MISPSKYFAAGAAAKAASKVRRESALDMYVTVPPSGYRRDFRRV
jgi:hypothetical protein